MLHITSLPLQRKRDHHNRGGSQSAGTGTRITAQMRTGDEDGANMQLPSRGGAPTNVPHSSCTQLCPQQINRADGDLVSFDLPFWFSQATWAPYMKGRSFVILLLCSDVPGKMSVRLAMKFFCRVRVEYCEEHPHNQSSYSSVRAMLCTPQLSTERS